MIGPIKNAKDRLLTANPGTLPSMVGAMENYFQPMTATILIKETVNFEVRETPTPDQPIPTPFMGVKVPYTAQRVDRRPEGERQWKWFTLYCTDALVLGMDDEFTLMSPQLADADLTSYRVMGRSDYSEYGFLVYEIAQDYTP